MASLIQGYEFDIFISYRQKDNKHDGWVTEFVDNLKGELESTFKEEINVYFDINPNDGLLETHDVDASLKNKLKCLVFIPIISRTYCDPKSFAWEHEFKAFVEQASQDQFGLKIKLANGNVASRVLPIKINDLDPEDKTILENELGGVFRCVEFVYKEAGVNRPLSSDDDAKGNLNKTNYRNQVNKVALAIKEIITAIRQHIPQKDEVPKEGLKSISVSRRYYKTKIIVGSVIVLALIVLGYFLIPKHSKPKEQVDKSIAVLPFKSLSNDPDKQYLADGIMDAILLHLSKIKDLRVMSRTSVEQYRKTDKTLNVIGTELNVAYLLEGSFQKFGDNARLIVQLIKTGKEGHLWANDYDRNWSDIFKVQSEVAQKVADELNAAITPEEKQLINKIPTSNLTAYDFYQQGREEFIKGSLKKAETLYYKALKYDSTFAKAYSGLAWVYWDRDLVKEKEYFSKNFMDSVLSLTNIALTYDDKLSDVYTLRGKYYHEIWKPEQALEEYDKAIKLNPNDWMAYYEKGESYYNNDFLNMINYIRKAASVNRGAVLPYLLGEIGTAYAGAGFSEKANNYYLDKLKLDGDSLSYYGLFGWNEFWLGNFNKFLEYEEKAYVLDSTNGDINFMLGEAYSWLGRYKEALKYKKKEFEKLKSQKEIDVSNMHRMGIVFWQNGYKKEAEYCFNKQIENCNRSIELKRSYVGQILFTYYDLAGVYAFRGEKDKAYKNLRIFNQLQKMPLWMVTFIKTDPFFNNIRNDPEFQQIAREIESKCQAEHERVRKSLEERGPL